jgi:transposase
MSPGTDTKTSERKTEVQRRRRWAPEHKIDLVKKTFEPGMTVSMVARQAGIATAQLFQWKKAYREGSLVAVCTSESDISPSELVEALRRIQQLEAALGRKTLENEMLKDAVEYGRARKWMVRSTVLPESEQ